MSHEFSVEKLYLQRMGNQTKVIPLSQDVITLETKERTLLPKHLALGMTIGHLPGSTQLQQLMNSFGHCVSYSLTLEHDTGPDHATIAELISHLDFIEKSLQLLSGTTMTLVKRHS